MKFKLLENIINYHVKPRSDDEWKYIKALFEDFFPNINLQRHHEAIFHTINNLYKKKSDNLLKCAHIHLPYQTEKNEVNLALFILNVLRFKETLENLQPLERSNASTLFFINNKIDNPEKITNYLSIHDGKRIGKSNIFNIVFRHDSVETNTSRDNYIPSNFSGTQLKKRQAKQRAISQIKIKNYKFLANILEYFNSTSKIFGVKELNLMPSVYFMCLKRIASEVSSHSSNIWTQYILDTAIKNRNTFDLNNLRACILNHNVNLTKVEDDDTNYYNIHNKSIFFDLTKTVVLFNTLSRKRTFDNFNYRRILEHIENGYCKNIKRQLVITYERKKVFSFLDYRKKLDQVKTRYKVNTENNTLTIFPFDFIEKRVGSIYFEDLKIIDLLDVFYERLYEVDTNLYAKLLSIWFFNLLSNIHNETIKNHVWRIVKNRVEEGVIVKDLKSSFDALASKTISKWENLLEKYKDTDNLILIIPSSLSQDKTVVKSLKKAPVKINVSNWKNFKEEFLPSNFYLILDYRDSKYDHTLSPNILDLLFQYSNVSFHFLSIFFEKRFLKNTISYLEKIIQPLLLSERRGNYFDLNRNIGQQCILDLEHAIAKVRSIEDQFEDVDESAYEQQTSDTIKISFRQKQLIVSRSEKFIVKITKSQQYKIIRADELEDYYKIEGQRLSELYVDFNLFENESDKSEINKFKAAMNLNIDKGEWLWKELLRQKVEESTFEELYEEIEQLSKKDKFHLVSKPTFSKTYLNPKNNSLPREKRIIKSIFNFLGLPRAYYRLVIVFKAREILKSRKSNFKMELLIESLLDHQLFPKFDPKMFNKWFEWIENSKKIDLEDVGLFDNVENDIKDLVKILKDNIKLGKITKIEIINND